jgi:hypothetical protein
VKAISVDVGADRLDPAFLIVCEMLVTTPTILVMQNEAGGHSGLCTIIARTVRATARVMNCLAERASSLWSVRFDTNRFVDQAEASATCVTALEPQPGCA